MAQYIFRRILLFIPTIFFITVISFGIIHMAPGDPAEMKAGIGSETATRGSQQVSAAQIEQIRALWHLDKPVWFWTMFTDEKGTDGELKPLSERLMFRWNGLGNQYVLWIWDVLHGHLGKSFQDQREVLDKIVERLPVTIMLEGIAILLIYLIAIPIGIYSASHVGSMFDKISSTAVFILYSLPDFWIATLLIVFFAGGDFMSIFPSSGLHSMAYDPSDPWFSRATDYAWHIILPIFVMTYGGYAFLSRQMRGSMLEVIRQDYIRTARAKGLSERVVIYKHALRNSLIPIITILANLLPALVGGSIIIETIFTIPGIGWLAFQALLARDYPLILAEFLLSTMMTLVGILLADIVYSIVDPRIAFSKKTV
jgi:peptide/nickel transport system permease protein